MAPPVRALIRRIAEARASGDLELGLRLSWDLVGSTPDARARGTLWACRFRAAAGEVREALAALEAGSDAGLWWAPGVLETDPDLTAVRDLPGFGRVLATSAARWSASNEDAAPDLQTQTPDGAGPFPLLVVLHLGPETDEAVDALWLPAAARGVAVALVGSPTRASSDQGSFTWAEPMRTQADVGEALARLSSLVPFDDRIAFAGSGESGRAAAQLALRGEPVASTGFVAIAPDPFDVGAEPLVAAAARGTRGCLVSGHDQAGWRSASSLVAELERAGVRMLLIRGDHDGGAASSDPGSQFSAGLSQLFDP